MKKKVLVTIFLIIVIMFAFIETCFAYEDELFEFDLPSNYANMSYQSFYIFGDTSGNTERGFMIYAYENSEIKKSVWDIDEYDINKLVRQLGYGSTVVSTDRRAKLGKEKAVEIILRDGSNYIDIYIMASNKYIYMAMFFGETQAELSNPDYEMIKNSFKLKDATTNYKAIFTVGFIILIIVVTLFSSRRRGKHLNIGNNIDYKNMTEEDFNIKQ